MENLMIDSCVFFGMIEYNNFVTKYGAENLDQYLLKKKDILLETKNKIKTTLSKEFFEKYSDLSFDAQVDKYKEWVNNREAELNLTIKSDEGLVNNPNPKIPAEKKERAKAEAENLKVELQNLVKFDEVKDLLNSYRLKKNSMGSGLIYKGALAGKYKLNTNGYSYDEILNHTKQKDDENWLCFSRKEVDDLTKKFTIIYTKSKEILDQVDKMAEDYRTEIPENQGKTRKDLTDKAMGQDVNSVGEFGDSKIMAFTNLTGMVLVTHNAKDFIFDKGVGKNNTCILNHITRVNKKYFGTTDAKAYTTFDILKENYEKPAKAPGYKIQKQQTKNLNFEEELAMC